VPGKYAAAVSWPAFLFLVSLALASSSDGRSALPGDYVAWKVVGSCFRAPARQSDVHPAGTTGTLSSFPGASSGTFFGTGSAGRDDWRLEWTLGGDPHAARAGFAATISVLGGGQ